MLIRIFLLALVLGVVSSAHAFVPVPPRDPITVALNADTIVVAKPIGSSRWSVLRSLKGALTKNQEILVATGDYDIGNADRAIFALGYDAASKVWYPHSNGVKIVADDVTYDFYAGDAT